MPTILFIPRVALPSPADGASSAKLLVCPDCGTAVDGASRSCASCGRVLERLIAGHANARPSSAVGPLSPTAAGAWLVLAVLLVVVVGGPIYWWRSQYAQVPRPETELQMKNRLQSEAETEMLKESTNVIVGLTRIIHSSVVTAADNPYKWAGDVTAEYVNRVGGIERTNVLFKFGTDTGMDGLVHLRCSSESETERRSRQHGDKHEFGRWFDRSSPQ